MVAKLHPHSLLAETATKITNARFLSADWWHRLFRASLHRSAVVVIDSRDSRPAPAPAPAPAPGGEEENAVASGGACVRGLDICQVSDTSSSSLGGITVGRTRLFTL